MRESAEPGQHQGGENPQAPQSRPLTGEPEIDIGMEVRNGGDKVDAKRASAAIKENLLRKPVQLANGLTVRLVRVRERSPATFGLVPIGE